MFRPKERDSVNRARVFRVLVDMVQFSKIKRLGASLAEGQGFEPWGVSAPLVFKTSALDHSATPPGDA